MQLLTTAQAQKVLLTRIIKCEGLRLAGLDSSKEGEALAKIYNQVGLYHVVKDDNRYLIHSALSGSLIHTLYPL